MAVVKPLQLKREKVEATQTRAHSLPFARVLVDHQIVHLDQIYDYSIPETLSERAIVGALIEIEFGHSLTQGILLERLEQPSAAGDIKSVRKVLSTEPYVTSEELSLVFEAATLYGTKPWDFIRGCVPPYSKMGEKEFLSRKISSTKSADPTGTLPKPLSDYLRSPKKFVCAIELPSSNPYWRVCVDIALERLQFGSVLLLLASERELSLLEDELAQRGQSCVSVLSTQGKSERYRNYLAARTPGAKIILGLRSSSLHPLPPGGTVLLLDDVDESHYERKAPTWNSRSLVELRERTHSVVYASTSTSLEIAERVTTKELPYYRFPPTPTIHFRSATSEVKSDYFALIGEGLKKGSVLISVGAAGYVTSFSCQKCRNLALCTCGGRLYFPARGKNPICSTCSTEFIEWSCTWCHESKPRIVKSGVARRAEEFGRAFPRHSVIHSSSQNPVAYLPEGNHIVLSTPGVEPRGQYATQIFLDLEGRLMRTTLRSTEETRYHLQRTISMLKPTGTVYLDLPPSDSFLQSILRSNPLLAAEREIAERSAAELLPVFTNILLLGEALESAEKVLSTIEGITLIGPFLRNGRKGTLLKAPKAKEAEIIKSLQGLNRIQSMRKEGLLTYLINPYSLN